MMTSGPDRKNRGERAGGMFEAMEGRVMLAAGPGPRVVDVFADNRGMAVITVDQPLNPATVHKKSVQIVHKNKAKKATISYDAAKKQIKVGVNGNLKKNTVYTLRLKSSLLKAATGAALDGEFNGDNKQSGNGKAGGDFVAKTQVMNKRVYARIATQDGNIDLSLFKEQTPKTVKNFLAYANAGDWDGIFFHQLIEDQALFGGFVKAEGENAETLKYVRDRGSIQNEPHPGRPGNVFGTIAMNRAVDFNSSTKDDQNSASATWFLNLGDNRELLDRLDGGYTVFGKVRNRESKRTIQRIGSADTYDANANFNFLPVRDVNVVLSRTEHPVRPTDLFVINRVSIEMALVKVAPAGKRAGQ